MHNILIPQQPQPARDDGLPPPGRPWRDAPTIRCGRTVDTSTARGLYDGPSSHRLSVAGELSCRSITDQRGPEGGLAMGRGRAKAKQTKVAGQLKYGTVSTDLSALQSELTSGQRSVIPAPAVPVADDVEDIDDSSDDDPYAKYYDEDDDDGRTEATSRA